MSGLATRARVCGYASETTLSAPPSAGSSGRAAEGLSWSTWKPTSRRYKGPPRRPHLARTQPCLPAAGRRGPPALEVVLNGCLRALPLAPPGAQFCPETCPSGRPCEPPDQPSNAGLPGGYRLGRLLRRRSRPHAPQLLVRSRLGSPASASPVNASLMPTSFQFTPLAWS
jgi:hypothetical protein